MEQISYKGVDLSAIKISWSSLGDFLVVRLRICERCRVEKYFPNICENQFSVFATKNTIGRCSRRVKEDPEMSNLKNYAENFVIFCTFPANLYTGGAMLMREIYVRSGIPCWRAVHCTSLQAHLFQIPNKCASTFRNKCKKRFHAFLSNVIILLCNWSFTINLVQNF